MRDDHLVCEECGSSDIEIFDSNWEEAVMYVCQDCGYYGDTEDIDTFEKFVRKTRKYDDELDYE